MKIAEQLKTLKDNHTAKIAALEALHSRTLEESRGFTEDEQKSWDEMKDDLAKIEKQVEVAEEMLRIQATKAIAIKPEPTMQPTAQPLIITERNLPKATAFTRYVGALALSKGNLHHALEISKRWRDSTPEVEQVLKAAVAAGTTTGTDWAAPLVQYTTMTDEFIEMLRPLTILGRLTGLRTVPFNVRIARQTGGSTVGWVGEGLSKPVGKLTLDAVTFPFAKVAGIIVITEELARFSSPSAEALVRNDLIENVAVFLDAWFLSASAAVASVSPAGIRNGVTAIALGGAPPSLADVNTALSAALLAMTTAQIPMRNPYWIMHTTTAIQLGMMRGAMDTPAFPGMAAGGGNTLYGIPVLTTSGMTVDATPTPDVTFIILIDASEIYYASDGPVVIDASREASLQMDSAPATPPTPLVSLWQQNMIGIKAEVFRYWQVRRAGAVQAISGVPVSGLPVNPALAAGAQQATLAAPRRPAGPAPAGA